MAKSTKAIQERLNEVLGTHLEVDGKMGQKTKSAIRAFQKSRGLEPDGIVGPRTEAALWPPEPKGVGTGKFDAASEKSLSKTMPELAKVIRLAREEVEFRVLDSTRGEKAQEKAFREGKSKAHFGQSAHNYEPAIAVDLFPAPYSWNDLPAFDNLSKVVLRIAKEQKVPIRWGGDWNQDGDKTRNDGWDKPHYELTPWRTWSKKSKLFKG